MKKLKMTVVILAAVICLFGISGTAYAKEQSEPQVRKTAAAPELHGASAPSRSAKSRPVSAQRKKKADKPKPPKNQIISIKSEISVRRGVAALRGSIILKSAKRIDARMQLQLYKKGKWITVKSWDTSPGRRKTLILKQSAVLKKGYKYRLSMTYKIDNGKTIKISRVVKY